jgi:soluble lytic murein transglycosylase-like protein
VLWGLIFAELSMPLKNARLKVMCGLSLLCLSSALWPWPTSSAEFPTRYDSEIKSAVATWWPDLPAWKLLKAQYWQESRLNPDARSPVGAEGIVQFMEPTWRDAIRALGWPQTLSRRDAAYAITGGAWYMRKLRGNWGRGRSVLEKHDLALASYNAGLGSIIKAQKVCADALLWPAIAPCLVHVTGPRNARETTNYVAKTHLWHKAMTP